MLGMVKPPSLGTEPQTKSRDIGGIQEEDECTLKFLDKEDRVNPNLRVGAVLLPAFVAGEQVSLCATCTGHLVLTDGLLGHGLSDLLQLITGHLLIKRVKPSAYSSAESLPQPFQWNSPLMSSQLSAGV